MFLPFRDRVPTDAEVEKIRLILSTFRDGSGMQNRSDGTEPGWRDAERSFAAALGGFAPEGKGIFDVIVPAADGALPYGLSIKTSTIRNERSVISELHNSQSKAQKHLNELGIDWTTQPAAAGSALVWQVLGWHDAERQHVDVGRSSYVHLVHDRTWTTWRILWFPLDLLQPVNLTWDYSGARIFGKTAEGHTLWEWYGRSGGQLKWYPLIADAVWDSGYFELEPAVAGTLVEKAQQMYPHLWPW